MFIGVLNTIQMTNTRDVSEKPKKNFENKWETDRFDERIQINNVYLQCYKL